MSKKPHSFGWEHEPKVERASAKAGANSFEPLAVTSARLPKPAQSQRDVPNPRDSSLSRLAEAWLKELPDDVRPDALSKRYPRIAKRLALC